MAALHTAKASLDGVQSPVQRHDHRDEVAYRYGWIDAHAALAHLGLSSLTTLYRLITDYRLPYGRVGRQYRFRRADLDEWARVQPAPTLVRGR